MPSFEPPKMPRIPQNASGVQWLANTKVEPLLFPIVVKKEAGPQTNSPRMTMILVLNYMIGTGILNQPQVFKEAGIAAATLLYMTAGVATWVGLVVLVEAAEQSPFTDTSPVAKHDYTSLAGATYGAAGRTAVDSTIVVGNLGATISYLVVIADLTSDLLENWLDYDGWAVSLYVTCPAMVLLFVLGPCLMRHFSDLIWLAALSITAISGASCLVVFWGRAYAISEGVPRSTLRWLDCKAMFEKLGSVVFALGCASAAFHAYLSMEPRSLPVWRDTTAQSVVLGSGACYIIGLAGYLAFRDDTDGDILDNFSGNFVGLFKVLVVVHLCFYIPNEFVVMRHSLCVLFGVEAAALPPLTFVAVTVGLLAFMVAVVLALAAAGIASGTAFGYILDLVGGVCGSLVSFCFPALFYLRATGGEGEWAAACKVLAGFGAFAMAATVIATLA